MYGNNGICDSSMNLPYDQHGFCASKYTNDSSKDQYTCIHSHITMMDIIFVFFSACLIAKYILNLSWETIGKTIMLFIGILYLAWLFAAMCLFLMHFLVRQNISQRALKGFEIYIFSSSKYSFEYAECDFGDGHGDVYIIINMMFLMYVIFMGVLYIIRVSWHDLGKISVFLMGLMIIRQIIGSLYAITNTCLYISYGNFLV